MNKTTKFQSIRWFPSVVVVIVVESEKQRTNRYKQDMTLTRTSPIEIFVGQAFGLSDGETNSNSQDRREQETLASFQPKQWSYFRERHTVAERMKVTRIAWKPHTHVMRTVLKLPKFHWISSKSKSMRPLSTRSSMTVLIKRRISIAMKTW